MLWEYPQVVQIPPYLLKNVFSKGSHILPVNEKLDNILCSFASEVYGLVKAGFGFAFVPEYLAIPDRELVFYLKKFATLLLESITGKNLWRQRILLFFSF